MVTAPKSQKTSRQQVFSAFLGLTLITLACHGQKSDAYRVMINMGRGAPPLSGFLYAVNDSAIVILPSMRQTPKALPAALENVTPVSIPSRVIKKLKVAKVRSAGGQLAIYSLLTVGYAIGYIAIFPVNNTVGLIPYGIAVVVLPLLTMDLLQSKSFRPGEPGFVMFMQKYCLKSNGLAVDR